ncbi:regulatory protein RecX [Fibrivirga algicola]|uniref:Regulatory protein RecX n=1 Tax=Fibrivirga algicola TaxID=2950420 RepID=A0ABX0QHU6_9BACT|nr:regulatory protein RecX [Fibrivirga algicola]ARK10488.1 RecX family transcriptional regulator [Fibrella sp. ES10-3-2-2]NID11994.1 RecX family transcriptional regulator [Fibrivirga algicola]
MTEYLKDALRKAASFCAYQERTQQEVRKRLDAWDIYGDDAEEIIAELITQGFLSEERFATAFAGGKFRIKGWGKRKITQELAQRGITGYNLNKALAEIKPDDYRGKLTDLLEKKRRQVRDDNPLVVKQKLARYALSKGYEPALVWEVLGTEE